MCQRSLRSCCGRMSLTIDAPRTFGQDTGVTHRCSNVCRLRNPHHAGVPDLAVGHHRRQNRPVERRARHKLDIPSVTPAAPVVACIFLNQGQFSFSSLLTLRRYTNSEVAVTRAEETGLMRIPHGGQLRGKYLSWTILTRCPSSRSRLPYTDSGASTSFSRAPFPFYPPPTLPWCMNCNVCETRDKDRRKDQSHEDPAQI